MSRQKVALVTGASSGIGYATAKEFALRGYKTYSCARRIDPMLPLKEFGVIPVACDVTSPESVAQLKHLIAQECGGYLDVLYNNAGQSCSLPALDVTDDMFKQCFEVNVFAPMRLTREFTPLLAKAKGIVGFTGSVAGLVPFPFSSVYGSSKAAIHQYAAMIRPELEPLGVRVLNIVTGGVKTNIADTRSLPENSIYNIPGMDEAVKERQQMAVRNNPLLPEVYARQVVNDFERVTLRGTLNVYRGKMAYLLGFLMFWCPRFIAEKAFLYKFHMTDVFNRLATKYAKEHTD